MNVLSFVIFLIFIIAIVHDTSAYTDNNSKCTGQNEMWYDRHGGCDPTCENPDLQCKAIKSGCFCKKGYVRNNGKCILLKHCPAKPKCDKENEIWYDSHGGCDPTCENPDLQCKAIKSGCFCKKGYVRNNGKCILLKHCPAKPKCDKENEIWYDTHGGCDPTCENPDLQCEAIKSGCFCKKGYVRNNGKCILLKHCPAKPKCDNENEKWYDEHGGCDPTCENPNLQCKALAKGCFCKEGFVRNNGKCILLKDCPAKPKCDKDNEIWYDNHGGCDPTCENPDIQCDAIVSGCFCKAGYVRNNGECILKNDCPPKKKCEMANEMWYDVHGGCDPTCENPDRQCRARVSGCFCMKDFVRYNTLCIHRDACPAKPPPLCPGQNELWQTNHGGCDPTCEYPDRKCEALNAQGCFCVPGYVRDKNNKCIEKSECPSKRTSPPQYCTGRNMN